MVHNLIIIGWVVWTGLMFFIFALSSDVQYKNKVKRNKGMINHSVYREVNTKCLLAQLLTAILVLIPTGVLILKVLF